MTEKRINLDEPRYDQNTFEGRAKHFFITTNPLNIFVSGKELDHAKSVVEKYRKGDNLPGMSEDEIWRAKHLYDSAFHPDTKEKMLLIGRMSAQVPMNMTITGFIPPFIMNYLDKKPFMQRMPWINAPLQVLLVGFFLVFATPLCCALFPQKSSMHVNHLEHGIREKLQALPNAPDKVYFNKGL
ncbi:hypothetical protein KUTeg_004810 [Tegillarca granosa]|uniref:Sideroflexin n=1 Tax=Tegillarca granosa TaxID=220873 RepID=A0ABQ9FJT3_TEGGR|nr:hypothetical protein KUTeg_004810 [Tegillarca granosa]